VTTSSVSVSDVGKPTAGRIGRAFRAWSRPIELFVRIILTNGVTRLCHGQEFLLATEGDTFQRGLREFRGTPRGGELAERRPDSLGLLRDHSALWAYGAGTLARAYAEFMTAHGQDEDYYASTPIAVAPKTDRTEEQRWFRARVENGHDLRHLITGYPPDRLGEICLLSFRAGQNGHRGAICLTLLGLLHPQVKRAAVFEAFSRGRRAKLLDLLPWEDSLTESLPAVRACLGLTPTRRYPDPCAPEAYLPGFSRGRQLPRVIEDTSHGSDGAVDLADTFGPMAAMHAALDRVGAGMPCGVIARFRGAALADVDAAVGAAAARFPVLRSRLAWRSSRPALVPVEAWRPSLCRAGSVSLSFRPDEEGPLWRYALKVEGEDVWLSAVWAHGAADGRSMLHFLGVVAAALDGRGRPARISQRHLTAVPISMARWLPRFVVERHLPYVGLASGPPGAPDVAWLSVPRPLADEALARARDACGGVAAWLAAAACLAFCEQQRGMPDGRVSLNLLISRDDLASFGGFGFAVGSLLMPVRLKPRADVPSIARRILARQRVMMAQGWDDRFQQFLGRDPARRHWFASLEAAGAGAPTVSVSWKGEYPDLGEEQGVSDVACFAASRVAHVSAHMDAGGLSISVASRQSPAAREALLRRVAGLMAASGAEPVRTLGGLSSDQARPSDAVHPTGPLGELPETF
jgi:ubiquinone biosynthesis protein Coq4